MSREFLVSYNTPAQIITHFIINFEENHMWYICRCVFPVEEKKRPHNTIKYRYMYYYLSPYTHTHVYYKKRGKKTHVQKISTKMFEMYTYRKKIRVFYIFSNFGAESIIIYFVYMYNTNRRVMHTNTHIQIDRVHTQKIRQAEWGEYRNDYFRFFKIFPNLFSVFNTKL